MDSEPPSSVSVIVDDPAWLRAVDDAEAACRRAAAAALGAAGPKVPPGPVEVGVVLTDDESVRELNRRYRGRDRPTNVLSFPADAMPVGGEEATPLGDVILALGTVLREAGETGTPAADHLSHLVVHGTLHLLGYDHGTDAEAAEMEALETAVLARLGVPGPYAGNEEVAAEEEEAQRG